MFDFLRFAFFFGIPGFIFGVLSTLAGAELYVYRQKKKSRSNSAKLKRHQSQPKQ